MTKEPKGREFNLLVAALIVGTILGSGITIYLFDQDIKELKQTHLQQLIDKEEAFDKFIEVLEADHKRQLEAQDAYATIPKEALVYICAVPSFDEVVVRKNRILCERKNGNIFMASQENTIHNMDDERN